MEVLLVLGKKNRLFNFSLPTWIIVVSGSLVAAVLVTFVYNLLNVTVTEVDRARLTQLNRENEVVRRELKKIEGAINELSLAIDSLESYDKTLRTYADLAPVNKSVLENPRRRPDSGRAGPQNFQELCLALDELLKRAAQQKTSSIELIDLLDEKKYLRDHTPSILPVQGWFVSGFGYRLDPFTGEIKMHEGIDIAGPTGTPIVAPASGTVKAIEEKMGFGLTVEIDHGNGCTTFYAHCQRSNTSIGAAVKRGDVIAYLGDSGRSTGPHLHYEVRINRQATNPMNYIIINATVCD